MARLFEFSDQAWLPRTLRRFLTDLLEFQASTFHLYEEAIPKLNEALRRAGSREILDLCSGSGGPLLRLKSRLSVERVTLSDRFPESRPAEEICRELDVAYLAEPLDARNVPPRLTACRTLFTSFHHFDAPDARRILASAVEARAPIAVFEFTERSFARLWRMVYAPIRVWCDTWRVRPRRASRLFWTYVVPVVPLVYSWDAFVSHLRSYSPQELRALTAGLDGHEWEAGFLPSFRPLVRVTYLIGLPADSP
jgi:hypothetical protein